LIPSLKKKIKEYSPDLVHAHYASSYGLLAFLAGFRPYVVSIWGSDIMVFPKKNRIAKSTIIKVLKNAKQLFVTSKYLAEICASELQFENTIQIPFGIDTSVFKPETIPAVTEGTKFIIAKSLTETYGIDIAIKSFVAIKMKYPEENISLTILGDGPKRKDYEELAEEELNKSIFFKGKVAHEEIANYLNQSQVLINCSRNESFGVSVLEASSCALAVIISNRGGLEETVQHQKTGIILDKLTVDDCQEAMEFYIKNKAQIKIHGDAGRKFVQQNFEQSQQVQKQINEYKAILNKE
jgi:glycosyltransferase involved in cell wall biosynthesis